MAAYTFSVIPNNTNNTNFRAWGQNVSSRILTAGLVQTSDTGQIDWGTVAAPGAAQTSAGYEIFRFADALQATTPIFLKLEYGSGSNANNPGLFFTVGSGSDGAGSLTGVTTGRCNVGTSSNSTSSINCFLSGNTGRLSFALWSHGTGSTTTLALGFGIERTVDANGAQTSEGALITWRNAQDGVSTGYKQLAWNGTTGNYTANETSWGMLWPAKGTGNGASGTILATYPQFFTRGYYLAPGYIWLGAFNNDFASNSTFTIPHYGANHTYIFLGNSAWHSIGGNRADTTGNTSMMMLYE